ncbi:hypothetical protein GCM10010446_14380 [Streptomyces enissocaesilis]|uniref:Uncharacterized protein n=1 Tax=Streptomyces enissocaesilis TaxID=332589 RepID=A0ABN3WWZ0_9ACTN
MKLVGRVGLEPKLVTRLTCGNVTEVDIHILLSPAASASIPGNHGAVRYVPHGRGSALRQERKEIRVNASAA